MWYQGRIKSSKHIVKQIIKLQKDLTKVESLRKITFNVLETRKL